MLVFFFGVVSLFVGVMFTIAVLTDDNVDYHSVLFVVRYIGALVYVGAGLFLLSTVSIPVVSYYTRVIAGLK